MKAISIIFLSLIVLSCKTEPKPTGVGVDYDPSGKKVEKPLIKQEDTHKFKTFKRESDSAIYKRLMDFEKDTQKSKIQSLKLKDKPAVKQ